jgi:hypothetical protein
LAMSVNTLLSSSSVIIVGIISPSFCRALQ